MKVKEGTFAPSCRWFLQCAANVNTFPELATQVLENHNRPPVFPDCGFAALVLQFLLALFENGHRKSGGASVERRNRVRLTLQLLFSNAPAPPAHAAGPSIETRKYAGPYLSRP